MTRTVEFNVYPTPIELADAWWSMDEKAQAEFFNRLGELTKGKPLHMQLQHVQDSEVLTPEGRFVMHKIGVYS